MLGVMSLTLGINGLERGYIIVIVQICFQILIQLLGKLFQYVNCKKFSLRWYGRRFFTEEEEKEDEMKVSGSGCVTNLGSQGNNHAENDFDCSVVSTESKLEQNEQ